MGFWLRTGARASRWFSPRASLGRDDPSRGSICKLVMIKWHWGDGELWPIDRLRNKGQIPLLPLTKIGMTVEYWFNWPSLNHVIQWCHQGEQYPRRFFKAYIAPLWKPSKWASSLPLFHTVIQRAVRSKDLSNEGSPYLTTPSSRLSEANREIFCVWVFSTAVEKTQHRPALKTQSSFFSSHSNHWFDNRTSAGCRIINFNWAGKERPTILGLGQGLKFTANRRSADPFSTIFGVIKNGNVQFLSSSGAVDE